MRIVTVLVVAAITTLLGACDPAVEATVEIVVDANVVAQHDAEAPGVVQLSADGFWNGEPVAVLCDPAAGEQVFEQVAADVGCAGDGLEVFAWVAPVPASAIDGLCDLPEEERLAALDGTLALEPDAAWPQASGELAFGELPEDECVNGSGSVTLEIR